MHPRAKLTAEQVRAIRRTPRYYGYLRVLSGAYGVHVETIRRVRRRVVYKQVRA